MSPILIAAIAAFFILVLVGIGKRRKVRRQRHFIDNYVFPLKLAQQIQQRYPHLSEQQCDAVIQGLRAFFHINLKAKRQMVSMPSQVVDIAWHEFILFTRRYESFCKQGLGRFLHHTPAEAMQSPTQAQDGIKRAWRLACLLEGINPKKPNRLPLLFSIDSDLKIKDGFTYKLNCKGMKDQGYCASHIGCGGGCSGGCASDSNGCGGGCGGGD